MMRPLSRRVSASPAVAPSPPEKVSESDYLDAVALARVRRDDGCMTELYRLILASPFKKGDMIEVTGKQSLEELSRLNTSTMARIGITMSVKAASGDTTAAKLMWDYAGYKPVERKDIALSLPTIIDDLNTPGLRERVVRELETEILTEEEEEEEDE